MNPQNSVALVTGANRGIGRALVAQLLQAGASKVYAAARDPGALANTIAIDPARVMPLEIDITDRAAVERAATLASDTTLLVNNAGVLDFGGILDVDQAVLNRNFSVNVFGQLNMARAFAPIIKSNGGGGIVNVITLIALASMPGIAAYNASKAALWSITQSLRATLANDNIAVFGVFPGAVDTDMLAGVEMEKASAAAVAQAIIDGMINSNEDIFPDAMSAHFYAEWKRDHKAVERQFAAM